MFFSPGHYGFVRNTRSKYYTTRPLAQPECCNPFFLQSDPTQSTQMLFQLNILLLSLIKLTSVSADQRVCVRARVPNIVADRIY